MLQGSLSKLRPAGKAALLLGLLLALLLFSALLGILMLVPFYGAGILQALSAPDFNDPAMVNAYKAMQIVNMAGGLLLPALLYVWLAYSQPRGYLKLNGLPSWLPLLLSAVIIIVAQPAIGLMNDWNAGLKLPGFLSGLETWMRNSEDQAAKITEAFLGTTSFGGLALNIFMIALLPALCEEILFRGVVAQLFTEWTRNIHWGIFISAFIFATIHLQFYGFLPRFLMGEAFGYLFYWTGSLWIPVTAHLANNLLSVLAEFLYRKGLISLNSDQIGSSGSVFVIILSLVTAGALMVYFRSLRLKEAV